jgi:hypothetical protein
MAEDLENDKWVETYFSLNCVSSAIIKLKKEFTNYAEELGWEVDVDKKGHISDDGERRFEVKIIPKGKKCSPEELREKRDLLEGFAVSIVRHIHYAGRENELPERVNITWTPYKSEDKKDKINIVFAEVFIIDVELKKLIKLELENHNLSKKAFGVSLHKWYEEKINELGKLFIGEEAKAQAEAVIKLMEENGMPKITPKKKGFLKKVFG